MSVRSKDRGQDSLKLTLHVYPAPGDDAAALAGWLRGELLDLDVWRIDPLPWETAPVGAEGSADIAALLLVQLDPKAVPVVLSKVVNWMARSDRMVEVSVEGHTLKLDRPEPGKGLVLLRPRETPPSIRRPHREGGELSRNGRLADARLLVKGRIDIEALPGQEFRRTIAFIGVSSLFGSGLAILLSISILVIAKHFFYGFSISTSYPVRRVYEGIVRYFDRVTPPPGSPHILLIYTIYLAVLPVLFAVVFMHLKAGSTKLVAATVACVIFMVAPFAIVITSIRVGSTNCGSWNYPQLNSGPECYSDLTIAFRVAFAVGVVGLAVPIVYLIRGRRHGNENGLLLRTLVACATVVMTVFGFIRILSGRQPRGDRAVAAGQNAEAIVSKYLLSHEREVITVRRHPAVLVSPSVLALMATVAAGVLTAAVLRGNESLVTAAWAVWLTLLVRLIWKAANWTGRFFVVTSQRIMLVSGVFSKKIEMLPLAKVTDMSFRRSFTGRLLGFGEFIIESAASNQELQIIDHLPYPEQLYLEVCGLIFRDIGQADLDEPDSDGE